MMENDCANLIFSRHSTRRQLIECRRKLLTDTFNFDPKDWYCLLSICYIRLGQYKEWLAIRTIRVNQFGLECSLITNRFLELFKLRQTKHIVENNVRLVTRGGEELLEVGNDCYFKSLSDDESIVNKARELTLTLDPSSIEMAAFLLSRVSRTNESYDYMWILALSSALSGNVKLFESTIMLIAEKGYDFDATLGMFSKYMVRDEGNDDVHGILTRIKMLFNRKNDITDDVLYFTV